MTVRILLFCLFIFFLGCSDDDKKSNDLESDWVVDQQFVTGQLALYPLVLNPEFTTVSEIELDDNERVGVINFGSDIIVYPYLYTYQSEVVNANYNGSNYAFTYCPITKSALVVTRSEIFRASGYLFKDNLTLWDDQTESIWSQMLLKGINGERKNEKLNSIPLLETKWSVIKNYFPSAKVLPNVGLSTRLSAPPDDNDNNNDNTSNEDAPEQLGKLVYGIVNNYGNVSIIDYDGFSSSRRLNVTINSDKYIVYGNSDKKIINAFKVGDFNNFQLLDDSEFPFIISDNSGKKYDIIGRSLNGLTLSKPKHAFIASWQAWSDFFDDFEFEN